MADHAQCRPATFAALDIHDSLSARASTSRHGPHGGRTGSVPAVLVQALRRAWVLALLCVWLAPSTTLAGNEDEVLLGGEAALSAGAVTATVRSGGALMYNPAGLSRVPEDTLDASMSALTYRRTVSRRLLRSEDGDQDAGTLSEFLVVPAALAYVRSVNERVRVALGIFQLESSDFLLQSRLLLPQADGSVHDWQVSVALTEVNYHGNLGLSFAVNEHFSLGVAAHVVYLQGSVALQISAVSRDSTQTQGDVFAGENIINRGTIWAMRLGAGMQWQPHEHLRMGVAVLGPAVLLRATSHLTQLIGAVGVPGVPGVDGQSSFTTFQGVETRRGFYMVLPTRIRAGLALVFGESWLSLDGDFQHAVHTSQLNIARDPVWNLRLGGQLALNDHVGLGAGLFTDRGSISRVREFGDTRAHFYGGTFGIRFGTKRKLAEDEADDSIQFHSTVAARYAYGSGTIGGLLVDDELETSPEALSSPAVQIRMHELSLYLSSSLMF